MDSQVKCKPRKKICFNCGVILYKMDFKHAHLCPKCQELDIRLPERIEVYSCLYCGTEFSKVDMRRTPKYCSSVCGTAYRKKEPQRMQAPTRTCVVCGKIVGLDRGHNAVTCSTECSAIHRKEISRRSNAKKSKSSTAPKKDSRNITYAMRDVVRLCAKLHISYGQYSQMRDNGTLDSYLLEHADKLT